MGLAFLLLLPSAHAGEPAGARLTRAEVLARVARGNADAARAMRAVDRARRAVEGELGAFDPVASVQLEVANARTPTDAGLSSGIAEDQSYALTAGLSRGFRSGTQLQLQLVSAIERSAFPFSTGLGFGDRRIVSGPNYQTHLVLRATQPVLRGFGPRATLARHEAAERLVAVRASEATEVAGQIATAALVAYAELHYAAEEVAVRLRSLARTEQQLEIASAEVEAGQVAPFELDQIRERVVLRREALAIAEAEQRRRGLEVARLAGLDGSSGPVVAVEPPEAPPEVAAEPADCGEAAAQSPAVAVLQAQRAAALVQVRAARDQTRPSLDVTAALTQTGLDTNWPGGVLDMLTFEGTAVSLGAIFSTPLGDRAAAAALDIALADVAAIDLEIDARSRTLCFELRGALDAVALLETRAALSHERAALAARAVAAEAERFAAGLSTVQQGLDALELIEAAELSLARVATDREIAWLQVRLIRGDAWRLLADAPPPAP